MAELFEAAEEVVEELFPPKPGGLVDRHRQRKAAEQAKQDEEKDALERIEQPATRSVKVAAQSPEVVSPITINVQPDNYAMILPGSPYRYRAVIKTSAAVTLAKDSGQAIGGQGYPLASTDPPFVTFTRGQLYAYNASGAVIQVSVYAELYAPEP